MDLAKIRQKARQEQHVSLNSTVPSPETVSVEEIVPAAVSPAQRNSMNAESEPLPAVEIATAGGVISKPDRVSTPALPAKLHQRAPLEVLLSGREASGCDDEQSQMTGEDASDVSEEYLEYLCFRVSDEIYGISIMDIKEIIKPREVTEVPRAPSFVSGVISLRGVIIPIIDMQERLGLIRETVTGRERVIVVRHGESFSGLFVDEIIQVVRIFNDCLEAAPAVLEGIDRDFVTGIGRADGRMIILLNLENIADIHLY